MLVSALLVLRMFVSVLEKAYGIQYASIRTIGIQGVGIKYVCINGVLYRFLIFVVFLTFKKE